MNSRDEIEQFLGAARFAPYLDCTGNDLQQAADLYHWNVELAGALHSQLCHVEVLVRNAMDRALGEWNIAQDHPRAWSLPHSAAPTLYAVIGTSLSGARKRATSSAYTRAKSHARRGIEPTHDDVITQLTFGNWSTLLGFTVRVQEAAVVELWRDALRYAFPYAREDDSGRRFIGTRMERLRTLRNRVSHHENLLQVDIDKRLADMLAILSAVGPDYPAWAMARSRVRAIRNADPRRHRQ